MGLEPTGQGSAHVRPEATASIPAGPAGLAFHSCLRGAIG